MAQKQGFLTFSLILSGICVKQKILWLINILLKLHAWEKSGSQSSSLAMRFQYFLIVNISLIDGYLTLIFDMYIGLNERNKAY